MLKSVTPKVITSPIYASYVALFYIVYVVVVLRLLRQPAPSSEPVDVKQ